MGAGGQPEEQRLCHRLFRIPHPAGDPFIHFLLLRTDVVAVGVLFKNSRRVAENPAEHQPGRLLEGQRAINEQIPLYVTGGSGIRPVGDLQVIQPRLRNLHAPDDVSGAIRHCRAG